MKRLTLVLCIFLSVVLFSGYFLFQFTFAESATILISEVQINPTSTDTGQEYVELVNISSMSQDISGWDVDAADLPYFTLPSGTRIEPFGTLRIVFRADGVNTSREVYTGASFGSTNMKNTTGSVVLFHSTTHTEQTIEDFMEYGATAQTHEAIALQRNLWTVGSSVVVNVLENYSLQRICQLRDASCWISTEPSTPNATILKDMMMLTSTGVLFSNTNSITQNEVTPTVNIFIDTVLQTTSGASLLGVHQLRIVASSGSTLHVEENGIPLLESSEMFEKTYADAGTYDISYFSSQGSTESPHERFTLMIQSIIPPHLFISEVAFSETSPKHDFIEFSYDGEVELPLDNFSLRIDGSTIPITGSVQHGQFHTLFFGGQVQDSSSQNAASPSSLVATTEQISLYYREQLVDGVCWVSSPIASTEVQDDQNFHTPLGRWSGACVESGVLSSGQTLVRKNSQDAFSIDAWSVYPISTPGKENIIQHLSPTPAITVQGTGQSSGKAPFDLNLTAENSHDDFGIHSYLWNFGDGTTTTEMNPLTHTYTVPGSYTVELTVQNIFGDIATTRQMVFVENNGTALVATQTPGNSSTGCSEKEKNVIFSEILPNPKGSDTDSEWVELHNPQNEEISFCSLELDDEEGGSAPFALKGKTIPAHGYLVVFSKDSHVVLSNGGGMVRLLSGGEVLDKIIYTSAPEGKSYAHIE